MGLDFETNVCYYNSASEEVILNRGCSGFDRHRLSLSCALQQRLHYQRTVKLN